MNKVQKENVLVQQHMKALKGSLCLWAALTCPDDEHWLDLMEDVLHAQMCDCYKQEPVTVWTVIIGHMKSQIGEA